MATMYQCKSWLSARQKSRLIEHFVAGSTALAVVEIVGVQPNTAIRFIASKLPNYQLCVGGGGGRELFWPGSQGQTRP